MKLCYPRYDSELGGSLLAVLGIASMFVCLMLISNSILQSYGRVHVPVFTMLIGGVVKIIFNYNLTAGTAIKCSVAELIILTTFVSVTQNGIGFGSLFKLYFCFFIPWIHIWMVLLRKLAVCFLDCSIICIFAYAEHLIIISLCLCHNTNTNLSVSLS